MTALIHTRAAQAHCPRPTRSRTPSLAAVSETSASEPSAGEPSAATTCAVGPGLCAGRGRRDQDPESRRPTRCTAARQARPGCSARARWSACRWHRPAPASSSACPSRTAPARCRRSTPGGPGRRTSRSGEGRSSRCPGGTCGCPTRCGAGSQSTPMRSLAKISYLPQALSGSGMRSCQTMKSAPSGSTVELRALSARVLTGIVVQYLPSQVPSWIAHSPEVMSVHAMYTPPFGAAAIDRIG